MRPTQVSWLDRRHRLGGRCFVIVRQMKAGEDKLFVFNGDAAKYLATANLDRVPLSMVVAAYGGGPGGWDWDDLRSHLTGQPPKALRQ
jgi:hypothetical protein